MKEKIELKENFRASPQEIYTAWLTSALHTKMTGGEAHCSNKVGSSFAAWDGYISGKNMELLKNEKIVQTWRTTEFSKNDEDSILTLWFSEVEKGTELTLIHENIPKGQTQYKQGWIEHYFTPMKAYFK